MKKLYILFLLILFSTAACDDDAVTPSEQPVPIVSAAVPATATVGSEVSINVAFTVQNACGKLGKFDTEANGTSYVITLYPAYVGKNCGTSPTQKEANYLFTPATAGTYTLRFWQGNNTYLTRTLEVQ